MAKRPDPNAPDPTAGILLQKFTGMKNTVTSERLGPDELEIAINVDLDDAGQVHRRRGRTRVATGNFHSLFTSFDDVTFGVKNGWLGIINPNFSFRALGSGYNDPLVYVQVGPKIYFSSRSIAGAIDLTAGPAIVPWGSEPDIWFSPVVNPTSTLPPIRGRLFAKPPLATQLAYYNGRIYMAQGSQVWATELYLYNFIDKNKNYWTFEAPVVMIGSVTDGVYVGTTEGVWFLGGIYGEMKRVRVMDSGVIPGSMVYMPAELANPPQVGLNEDTPVKVSILFLTSAGFCGGQDSGVCYNYSESKFVFPDAVTAVGAFRRQDGVNQYLVTTNSTGTPAANARIGDHIDAKLIRGGAWNTILEYARIRDTLGVKVHVTISDGLKLSQADAEAWSGPAFSGEMQLLGTQIGTADSGPTGTANLLQMASLFDAPDWVPIFVTVTPNASIAPDGTTTAYAVTETDSQGSQVHRLHQTISKAASAIQYTYSINAKQSARTRIALIVTDLPYCWTPGYGNSVGGNNGAYAVFDLAGGQIGVAAATFGSGFSGASATITAQANGFYRCTLTVTSNAATSLCAEVEPDANSGTNGLFNTYDGTSLAFYVWGAQLEAAGSASALHNVTANGHGLANLVDGDLTTWWEGPASQAWAGIDVGVGNSVAFTRYRFASRPGSIAQEPAIQYDFEALVNGATVQTSNDPTFGTGVTTQDTIPSEPPYYPRYWMNERILPQPNARAARLQSAPGAFGSLSELQFFALYNNAILGKPVKPVISPMGGRFPSGSTTVTMTSLTVSPTTSIFYTTDGSTPTNTNGTQYSGPFTLTLTTAATTVKAVAYDPLLSTPLSDVQTVIFNNYGFAPRDNWYDDRNILIEAHSGGITYANGRYYWYGGLMDKVSTAPDIANAYISGNGRAPRVDVGVFLYSSSDLYNWKFEGNILPQPAVAGQPWLSLTRMHVIYNAANNNYVLWAHAASFFDASDRAAVATSPSPTGPWTWVNTNLNPDGLGYKDCSLFLDPHDGNAYAVFTVGTQNGIRISRLNSSFTNTDGVNGVTLACSSRESPQLFLKSGTYFLITSVSNFYDDTSTYNVRYITTTASNPLSGWNAAPDAGATLFASDPLGGSFNCQPSFILIPQGKTTPFLGSDAWISNPLYNSRQVWLPLSFADATHVQATTPATWDWNTLT